VVSYEDLSLEHPMNLIITVTLNLRIRELTSVLEIKWDPLNNGGGSKCREQRATPPKAAVGVRSFPHRVIAGRVGHDVRQISPKRRLGDAQCQSLSYQNEENKESPGKGRALTGTLLWGISTRA